jgi:transposase InsO family protein
MLLAMLVWFCLLGTLLCHAAWQQLRWPRPRFGYRRLAADATTRLCRSATKPAWVRKELIRLKALMPDAGCRALSDIFNRLFAAKRKMTVGKTFVSLLIRQHRYEIEVVRRHIKNRRPRPVQKNHVWALDLTGKGTLDGRTRIVLGILEHASRASLCLEALESKSSWTLISKLNGAIRRYGKPRAVRTDNEAVFASRTFRLALGLLGIRHQRTDPGCPWQNGRVERFFGTLKATLDRFAVDSLEALNGALGEFRFFYNHVRPHQNLGGRTPAEAWAGDLPFARPSKGEYWFEAWDGLLCGYYFRR